MNAHLKTAEHLAKLLDTKFSLGKFSFGVDALLDFIPGVGPLIGTVLSFYIIWIGVKMRIPGNAIGEMITNVVLDTILGEIPLVGFIADAFFKANIKNLAILKKYAKTTIIEEAEILS